MEHNQHGHHHFQLNKQGWTNQRNCLNTFSCFCLWCCQNRSIVGRSKNKERFSNTLTSTSALLSGNHSHNYNNSFLFPRAFPIEGWKVWDRTQLQHLPCCWTIAFKSVSFKRINSLGIRSLWDSLCLLPRERSGEVNGLTGLTDLNRGLTESWQRKCSFLVRLQPSVYMTSFTMSLLLKQFHMLIQMIST